MNVFKLKKKIEEYLVDIEERYEQVRTRKKKEINDAIKSRREEDSSLTFDNAAIDVLLQRAVIAETVVELAKDLWIQLDLK